jgi:hypothetical protein
MEWGVEGARTSRQSFRSLSLSSWTVLESSNVWTLFFLTSQISFLLHTTSTTILNVTDVKCVVLATLWCTCLHIAIRMYWWKHIFLTNTTSCLTWTTTIACNGPVHRRTRCVSLLRAVKNLLKTFFFLSNLKQNGLKMNCKWPLRPLRNMLITQLRDVYQEFSSFPYPRKFVYHPERSCLPRSCLRWNAFTESLPRKGSLLRFHDFIFQSTCRSIFSYLFITMRNLFVLPHCCLMVRLLPFFNFV